MTNIRIIGDVHGKFAAYKELIKNVDYSIQLGDFGFDVAWWKLKRHKIDSRRHKIIPGNHDDYNMIKERKDYTFGKDYGLVNWYVGNQQPITTDNSWFNFFMVRGAFSVDKKLREKNFDWFENEEISVNELELAIKLYEEIKPDVILSHDCPGYIINGISEQLFGKKFIPNRTSMTLTKMLTIHQPKLWIFGHWHKTIIKHINNTTFVCLGELDYIDYEIDENIGNDVDWNIIKIQEQMNE